MGATSQAAACYVIDVGCVAYSAAAALQDRLVGARKCGAAPNVVLLCEHPHVVTLGRNGRISHLRAGLSHLEKMGVEFHQTNRGGDVTYHGPGQVVAYPILRLDAIRRDVVWYVRRLEEVMIRASAAFDVEAFRAQGRTGVWTKSIGGAAEEKLGAIGVHISRWVTSHGLAYNVSTDLSYFDLIVPCGIADCRVTSLEKLLARPVAMAGVSSRISAEFGRAFGLDMQPASLGDLEQWLADGERALAARASGELVPQGDL
jgi:lipoyl(octanoyl) transferase